MFSVLSGRKQELHPPEIVNRESKHIVNSDTSLIFFNSIPHQVDTLSFVIKLNISTHFSTFDIKKLKFRIYYKLTLLKCIPI